MAASGCSNLTKLEFTPAASGRAQQRECERRKLDFNDVRPHYEIGGKMPFLGAATVTAVSAVGA